MAAGNFGGRARRAPRGRDGTGRDGSGGRAAGQVRAGRGCACAEGSGGPAAPGAERSGAGPAAGQDGPGGGKKPRGRRPLVWGFYALLRRRGAESKLLSGVCAAGGGRGGAQGSGGKCRQLPSGCVFEGCFGGFVGLGLLGLVSFCLVGLVLLVWCCFFFNRAQRKTLVHNAEIGDLVAEAGIRKAAVAGAATLLSFFVLA